MRSGKGSGRAYEALRRSRPELFRNEPDGIEILPGAAGVRTVRRALRVRAAEAAAGGSRARYWWERLRGLVRGERIGVVAADRYLCLLRDPVRFPDGQLGLYNRIVPPPGATPGVVVLTLLGAGDDVVLVEHYRHSTRDWHWEAVRGFGDPGAEGAENVARELREELGARAVETIPLGAVHPDTGLFSGRVELYAARIAALGEVDRHEAIRRTLTVPFAEAERMAAEGELTDAFTLAALYRARLTGLCGNRPGTGG